MKNKPLIFRLLSLLFLIEPLIQILYFKATTKFDFSLIIENLLSRTSFKDIFDFWLVFPLAGLVLFKIRKWSYYVFLILMGYISFNLMTYEEYTWPYNSATPLFYNYILIGITIIAFLIFLVPGIREPFFNKRIRWWETKSRYKTNIPVKVTAPKLTIQSTILNISQTGGFIQDSPDIQVGDKFRLIFESHGFSIDIPVEVMSKHSVGEDSGIGVKFVPHTPAEKFRIYKLIHKIKTSQDTKDSLR